MQLTIWGAPWNPGHNAQRGNCLNEAEPSFGWAKCAVTGAHSSVAYLTLPTSCAAPLSLTASADSWQRQPGAYLPDGEPDLSDPNWHSATATSPASLEGCGALQFTPLASSLPTAERTTSASGLAFHLENNEEGLINPAGRSQSQIKKAVVALPEGVTINPSVGAGLGVCTPGQYAAETVTSPPGAGCPNDSKIGDFTVQSPLLEGRSRARSSSPSRSRTPSTRFALYMVAKAPERGLIVKVAGESKPTPKPGS